MADAKQCGDCAQLGLIHLNDRGVNTPGLDRFSREIVLTQIEVEKANSLTGRGDEILDRRSRPLHSLAKCAETDCVALFGQAT